MTNDKYAHLLKRVEKPGRYIGGELNSTVKDMSTVDLRLCFCFPDTYEIGMSNLGMRILIDCFNRMDGVFCERSYAPWPDMEEQLIKNGVPLYALESGDPLRDFDAVLFTLQYELCYTNVLNMLRLAGMPVYAKDRAEDMPLVVAGGPCSYNPEPLADFVDIFSIGEGEEALVELAELIRACKKEGVSKAETLYRVSQLEGFYVPSLYDVTYNEDGTLASFEPNRDGVPKTVKKRIIKDMDKVNFPDKSPMPYLDVVHDRVMLEVTRGCIRGCRFCQAGIIYRPYRDKSPDNLVECARKSIDNTGYSEISLTSLSISDYPRLPELVDKLLTWTEEEKVSLSLPSQRIDAFYEELMEKVMSVRKSGLTFAPEAGTQRLRDVINKNIAEDDILVACEKAFDGGRNSLKLYFMNGLPTETDEDIVGIANLAQKIVDLFYAKKRKGRGVTVTVSVSCFVPKPFTPFQWEAQNSFEELERKQKLLRDHITSRKIDYKYHDAKVSRLEAVFAKGDRRLGKALAEAVARNQRFDAWDEFFSYENWMDIFADTGIDPAFYANRVMGEAELLPWDFIDIGVTKSFLLREKHKAESGETTPDCRTKCSACGANRYCDGGCSAHPDN
ncbi:MAG: TIGR03960 family B12-binding radical SAM protein [Clostridia bacterium]|nr:TIGR03960 family B12-binding radical SAM protein [Clostridia bacterium]